MRERFVEPAHRRCGIGSWLVGHAAAWLRLGGTERILVPVGPEELGDGSVRFFARFGWAEIGRMRRGWRRAVTNR